MDSRAALGAAAAVALTVTGGVSALFLAVGQAAPADPAPNQAAVTVEYVDQFGNPIPAPTTATQASNLTRTPEIVLVNPDGTPVAAEATSTPGYGGQPEAEYPDPEAEHEEHEEYEEDESEEAGHHDD